MPRLQIYSDAFVDDDMERMLRRLRIADEPGSSSRQDRTTTIESAAAQVEPIVEPITSHHGSTGQAAHEAQTGTGNNPLISFRSPQRLRRLEEALEQIHESPRATGPTLTRNSAISGSIPAPVRGSMHQHPPENVNSLRKHSHHHQLANIV